MRVRIKKTEELLSKFKGGEERYRNDPVFNKVIMMLVSGADVYQCIDSLIGIIGDQQKFIEDRLSTSTPVYFINKEDIKNSPMHEYLDEIIKNQSK